MVLCHKGNMTNCASGGRGIAEFVMLQIVLVGDEYTV